MEFGNDYEEGILEGDGSLISCELCHRSGIEITEHHLTPKEEGGTNGPVASLCIACHKQIHTLYSNKELALCLHTLEQLKSDLSMRKFISWIRKQPLVGRVKTKRSHRRSR